jgi:hypothetical protein
VTYQRVEFELEGKQGREAELRSYDNSKIVSNLCRGPLRGPGGEAVFPGGSYQGRPSCRAVARNQFSWVMPMVPFQTTVPSGLNPTMAM